MIRPVMEECPTCDGEGEDDWSRCETCNGRGWIWAEAVSIEEFDLDYEEELGYFDALVSSVELDQLAERSRPGRL